MAYDMWGPPVDKDGKPKESKGGWYNQLGGGLKSGYNALKDGLNRDQGGNLQKLQDESGLASAFADQSQRRVGGLGKEATQERDHLRRIARGDESVSAMQLQNSLQQNQAAQQSMAAGARGGNSAMAARNAAMNAGRQGAGLAGQQAIAGIQERQQAQAALSNNLMQQRQQDLSATLGSRGQAIGGYGTGFSGSMQQPTGMEQGIGAAMGVGQLVAMSDERLKHNVKDGEKAADAALRGLAAHTFDYDDPKHGKGMQLGIMAQGLEKAGLGQAVFETPTGKAVHGAKLATGLAAMMPGLNKRLEKLEGSK